jgi:undecaprenyl-diphosphatase
MEGSPNLSDHIRILLLLLAMKKPEKIKFLSRKKLKETRETLRAFSFEFIILFCLLLISLFLLYLLVHFVIPENQNAIDNASFVFFNSIETSKITYFARFITFFGTGTFLIPAYLLIVYWLIRNAYTNYAMMVFAMVLSSLLLGWLLKPIFHRTRPPFPLVRGAGGYSFPSGHALGGFIFAGILLFLVWRLQNRYYLKWLLSLFITSFGLMIGLSRIYLHAHYATDVMGSLFITLAWFSLSFIFFRIVYKNRMHTDSKISGQKDEIFSQNYFLN